MYLSKGGGFREALDKLFHSAEIASGLLPSSASPAFDTCSPWPQRPFQCPRSLSNLKQYEDCKESLVRGTKIHHGAHRPESCLLLLWQPLYQLLHHQHRLRAKPTFISLMATNFTNTAGLHVIHISFLSATLAKNMPEANLPTPEEVD